MPLITVDAASGGPYEVLGAAIKAAGHEDSSGLRRCLVGYCIDLDILKMAKMLGIDATAARHLIIDFLQASPRRV